MSRAMENHFGPLFEFQACGPDPRHAMGLRRTEYREFSRRVFINHAFIVVITTCRSGNLDSSWFAFGFSCG